MGAIHLSMFRPEEEMNIGVSPETNETSGGEEGVELLRAWERNNFDMEPDHVIVQDAADLPPYVREAIERRGQSETYESGQA